MEVSTFDLASVAGIVSATGMLLGLLKPTLGRVPVLRELPVMLHAVLLSALLTWAAHDVFHTLQGDLPTLLALIVGQALAAAGAREQKVAGVKPVKATSAVTGAPVNLRGIAPVILMAAALTAATGCALKGQPQRQARALDVVVYDGLAAAQDVETAFYMGGQITAEQDRAFNAALAPALRIGKRLNLVILGWPDGAPTPPELLDLARHLDALVAEVLKVWPEGRVRDALTNQVTAVRSAVQFIIGGQTWE